MDAQARYQQRRQQLKRQIEASRTRYNLVAWARLVVLLAIIAMVVVTLWKALGLWGWLATAAAVGTFITLVRIHDRVAARKDNLEAADHYNQRCLDRLGGKWNAFREDGEEFLTDKHP